MPRSLRLPLLLSFLPACTPAATDPGDDLAGVDTDSDGDESDASTEGIEDGAETEGGSGADTAAAETSGAAGDDDGSDLDGEGLYLQLCAPCHGVDASGTELGYELQHPPRELARWVVRNGRPGDEFPDAAMAAYPPEALSDADLEAILDFLDAFPQPTEPEALYVDYCGNCHGPDALGGAVGKDIIDKEAHDIREKVREGEGTGAPGARALYMPATDAARLSDAEIDAIAGFIAGP